MLGFAEVSKGALPYTTRGQDQRWSNYPGLNIVKLLPDLDERAKVVNELNMGREVGYCDLLVSPPVDLAFVIRHLRRCKRRN